MARLYAVPMDLEQEEKTIGGVLTVKQLMYLFFTGAALGATVFVLHLFHVGWIWCIVISVPLWVPLGLFVAFYEKDGMSGDELILNTISFLTRQRKYFWGE